jgi:hypothetical protein
MAFALRRHRGRHYDDGYDDRPGAGTRATGAAAGAAGSALLTLARIIRLIGFAVAAILVAAILFVVFEANPDNGIVSTVSDWARWLAGPFKDLFTIDNAKTEIAVNYGLAALVYVAIAGLIARLLARGGFAGRRARERRVA